MVSVIIPCYNSEKTIGSCLESILNQTYSDIEVITVDDGSTDKTSEIIQTYSDRDSRILLIRKENGGVSSARNLGIHVAHGDWLLFVDSDDTILNTHIETLIKNDNEKKILEEINMLEYKYKTAIYLVKIEGLSYKQASEILGTSIQNVKNFIHRGKVKLRKNLIKGKFYNMNKILKIFIILITMTIFLSGFVYAGITVYKYFCQKTSKGNITEDMNSWFEINNQEMYYTKVSSYNEYLKYKNKWSSILDMSEESFKENFLVIIIATWRMPGIKISNISADTNYLYIEVENDVTELEIEKEEYMVSTIIPRTLDRENIVLKKKTKEITSNAYVKLEELPYNYTTKNAESDGCVVIEDYEIKIESKEKLNKFIENTKNKNDDYIRIYIKNREDIRIYDIEYINREYILYIDETRTNDFGNRKINYVDTYQSINIIKEENELQGLTRIYLENLLGTNIIVAIYNN